MQYPFGMKLIWKSCIGLTLILLFARSSRAEENSSIKTQSWRYDRSSSLHEDPETYRMRTEIMRLIPPRTALREVETRMREHGFKCELKTEDFRPSNGVVTLAIEPRTIITCSKSGSRYGAFGWTWRINVTDDFVNYIEGWKSLERKFLLQSINSSK